MPNYDTASIKTIKENIRIYKEAAKFVREKNLQLPNLHRSIGLSQAARDLACHIGAIGLLAPIPDSKESMQNGILEQAATYKFLNKYGKTQENSVIFENFIYSTNDPILITAKIFASNNYNVQGLRISPLQENIHIIGCAVEPHKTLGFCTILVYSDIFFENTILPKEPTVLKLKPVPAIYTPSKIDNNEFQYVFLLFFIIKDI